MCPISFKENKLHNTNTFEITIPPRTCQKINLPVNQPSGFGILNYVNFDNAEMPEALVKVENFHAFTTIFNQNPVKINILKPFEIETINESEINFVEKMETDIYNN